MFMRLKNKIFNIRTSLKYRKYPNIKISKQLKNFEFGELTFDTKANVEIKNGLIMKKNVSIRCRDNANLNIGENVYFNNNCILTCRNKIIIGNDVSIGPNVCIFDHDHDYNAIDRKHSFVTGEIIIEDNVWIGASSVILKGTHIGKNSVIAAGTVVNCDVPENSIYISKGKIKKMGEKNE